MESKTKEEKIKELRTHQIEFAKTKLQTFQPTYQDFGDIQIIDWKSSDPKEKYFLHYVLDNKNLCITTNDETALVRLDKKATLKSLSNCIYVPDKFMDHVKYGTCCYHYNAQLAEIELNEKIMPEDIVKYLSDEKIKARQELIKYILASKRGGKKNEGYDFEIFTGLENIDAQWREWLPGIGKDISTCVILWLVGLNMAYQQLQSTDHGKEQRAV